MSQSLHCSAISTNASLPPTVAGVRKSPSTSAQGLLELCGMNMAPFQEGSFVRRATRAERPESTSLPRALEATRRGNSLTSSHSATLPPLMITPSLPAPERLHVVWNRLMSIFAVGPHVQQERPKGQLLKRLAALICRGDCVAWRACTTTGGGPPVLLSLVELVRRKCLHNEGHRRSARRRRLKRSPVAHLQHRQGHKRVSLHRVA
jgi:hypothetical protein